MDWNHQPFANVDSRDSTDVLLRTTQQSLVQYSLMADNKANIMITVSSIVLSISLSQSGNSPHKWPLVIICISALFALILAILAVLPTIAYPKDVNGKPNLNSPSFNLLYFGHFSKLSEQTFQSELERITASSSDLYVTIAKDIHAHAKVLVEKKYLYLRWSYISFLCGAGVGAIAFVVEAVVGIS
ncbi:MAG: Pycsar system effector family protein [Cyanobacteria bacterium P01_A01_bin.3]